MFCNMSYPCFIDSLLKIPVEAVKPKKFFLNTKQHLPHAVILSLMSFGMILLLLTVHSRIFEISYTLPNVQSNKHIYNHIPIPSAI